MTEIQEFATFLHNIKKQLHENMYSIFPMDLDSMVSQMSPCPEYKGEFHQVVKVPLEKKHQWNIIRRDPDFIRVINKIAYKNNITPNVTNTLLELLTRAHDFISLRDYLEILKKPIEKLSRPNPIITHLLENNFENLQLYNILSDHNITIEQVIDAIQFGELIIGDDIWEEKKFHALFIKYRDLVFNQGKQDFTVTIILLPYEDKTTKTQHNSRENFVTSITNSLPKSTKTCIISPLSADISYTRHLQQSNIYIKFIQLKRYSGCDLFLQDAKILNFLYTSNILFVHPIHLNLSIPKDNHWPTIKIQSARIRPIHKQLIKYQLALHHRNLDYQTALKPYPNHNIHTFMMLAMSQDFKNASTILRNIPNQYKQQQQNLIILTDVPNGTLGDASAASKLWSILKQTPKFKDMHYTWIIREPNEQLQARDLIPDVVSRVILISNWEDVYSNPQIINLLLSAKNNILSYPTYRYLNEQNIKFFMLFNTQFIDAAEYDHVGNPDCHYHNNTPFIQTGLLPGSTGIFIDKTDHDDFDITCSNQTHIFFCYYNLQHNDTSYNFASIERFCSLAVAKSLHEQSGKNIEIIARAKEKDFDKLACAIHERNQRISHITLEHQGTTIVKRFSNIGPTVTIRNPYPLTHHDFKRLLAQSDPFCMLTGDGSASEGFGLNKIILYQVQPWKRIFSQALSEACEKYFISKIYDRYSFKDIGHVDKNHYISNNKVEDNMIIISESDDEIKLSTRKNVTRNHGIDLSNCHYLSKANLQDKDKILKVKNWRCSFDNKMFILQTMLRKGYIKSPAPLCTWFHTQFENVFTISGQKKAYNDLLELLTTKQDELLENMREFSAYLHSEHNVKYQFAKALYSLFNGYSLPPTMSKPFLPQLTLKVNQDGTIPIPREIYDDLQATDTNPTASKHHNKQPKLLSV